MSTDDPEEVSLEMMIETVAYECCSRLNDVLSTLQERTKKENWGDLRTLFLAGHMRGFLKAAVYAADGAGLSLLDLLLGVLCETADSRELTPLEDRLHQALHILADTLPYGELEYLNTAPDLNRRFEHLLQGVLDPFLSMKGPPRDGNHLN